MGCYQSMVWQNEIIPSARVWGIVNSAVYCNNQPPRFQKPSNNVLGHEGQEGHEGPSVAPLARRPFKRKIKMSASPQALSSGRAEDTTSRGGKRPRPRGDSKFSALSCDPRKRPTRQQPRQQRRRRGGKCNVKLFSERSTGRRLFSTVRRLRSASNGPNPNRTLWLRPPRLHLSEQTVHLGLLGGCAPKPPGETTVTWQLPWTRRPGFGNVGIGTCDQSLN